MKKNKPLCFVVLRDFQMSNHFLLCCFLFICCRDVNNVAIEAASYWMEPDIADYEWVSDWG